MEIKTKVIECRFLSIGDELASNSGKHIVRDIIVSQNKVTCFLTTDTVLQFDKDDTVYVVTPRII